MPDRDSAAKALATAMGWECDERGLWQPRLAPSTGMRLIPIPAPDAPLSEQLQFVGRLAELVSGGNVGIRYEPPRVVVCMGERVERSDGDLVLAAMLAAAAAKGGKP